jgi:hypothetical protein
MKTTFDAIRRMIAFVIESAMLIGRLYLLYFQCFVSSVIWFRFVIAGAVGAVFGASLLCEDFIWPWLGDKRGILNGRSMKYRSRRKNEKLKKQELKRGINPDVVAAVFDAKDADEAVKLLGKVGTGR